MSVYKALWVVGAVVLMIGMGCDKSAGKAAKEKAAKEQGAIEPVGVKLEHSVEPVSDHEARLTVHTAPGADVFFNVEGGDATPIKARADSAGKIVTDIVRATPGEHKVTLTITLNDGSGADITRDITVTIAKPATFAFADGSGKEVSDDLVSCSGSLSEEGVRKDVSVCDSSLRLRPDYSVALAVTAPTGKILKVGDVEASFTDGKASVVLPLKQAIAALSASRNLGVSERVFRFPVVLEHAGGKKTGDLELGALPARKLLTSVAQGPVLFEGEEAKAGARASLIGVGSVKHFYEGALVDIGKVDLVALTSEARRELGKCHYKNDAGDKKVIERVLFNLTVDVYERRTGKKLGSKTFKAPKVGCAEWVKKDEGDSYSSVHRTQARSYAESMISKK